MTIQNNYAGSNTIQLECIPVSPNQDKKTYFKYTLGQGETLTINGYTKILSSNTKSNPYVD